ncbi:hypothetical protein V6N12_057362 [Hibiscus sabdariffa]|uniref:RRM domain-containing protein n=1 Tax=Hibiscus sabdariffa TaxID=183260 RepID=A0ABR2DBL6_9ROSI
MERESERGSGQENIPRRMQWRGLWHMFARHGEVKRTFIAKKLSRGGKRFGFVEFESQVDANRALERLNDSVRRSEENSGTYSIVDTSSESASVQEQVSPSGKEGNDVDEAPLMEQKMGMEDGEILELSGGKSKSHEGI